MNLQENDALREADGKVYAVPVRGYWEGLYVHTDLFEQYNAPLPKDWDSLLEAIRIFRENDIIPISISHGCEPEGLLFGSDASVSDPAFPGGGWYCRHFSLLLSYNVRSGN